MQQRLVVWGDIGTDHKALIAIEFDAAEHKVSFRAFPEEQVGKELQNELFTVWKNGGEYKFPDDMPVWVVKADVENILPENIRLHKPEMLVQAQHQWNKKLELEDNFKVFGEKLNLLELALETTKEFNHDLWNKTRDLWAEISTQKKDGNLAWTHADELKIRVNSLFDGLKAFRRLNKENNFDESNALTKVFEKQIAECSEQLIYPDEWNNIFKKLVSLQSQIKDAPLVFKHNRSLRNLINGVFNDLRDYRKSDEIKYIEDRIYGLERVLRGLHDAIVRDEESYKNQFEKMKHYTRGKLSDAEIENQLKHLIDQSKDKRKKIKSIERTLRSLDKRMEALLNPPKPEPKEHEGRPGKRERKKSKEGRAVAEGEMTSEMPESGEADVLHSTLIAGESETDQHSEQMTAMPAEEVPAAMEVEPISAAEENMPEVIAADVSREEAPEVDRTEVQGETMEIEGASPAPEALPIMEEDSGSSIKASASTPEESVEEMEAESLEVGLNEAVNPVQSEGDNTAAQASADENTGAEESADTPLADAEKTARKPKAKPKPKVSSKSE